MTSRRRLLLWTWLILFALTLLPTMLPNAALAQDASVPVPVPDDAQLLFLPLLQQPAAQAAQVDNAATGNQYVKRAGPELRLNGKIFRIAGTNNYYLMYKSPKMVDDVLQAAAANNFNTIRMWGSLEIGNQDGSNSVAGKSDGVYFQYYNGALPAYNDGEDGLKKLDYAVYKAGQLGLRVVIPFVNNWNAFGGMDQYVRWRTMQDPSFVPYHDRFYTDPVIRRWFKLWILHLLTRTNAYTGVKYKDDPTILTWELANEPRCKSAGVYGESGTCTTQTITAWADEMSRWIKSIDNKHLISAGDEGFYCIPGATDWTENCGEGVDTLALAGLPAMDVLSFHLYPDSWGKDAAWGTQWIARHFQDARRINRPAMLGEFGILDKGQRNVVYQQWTDTVLANNGAGALYWILSGIQDDGTLYADYDGFTVYAGTPVFTTLGNFARSILGLATSFAPVADVDQAVTEFETPVTLPVAANDVAYNGATLLPATIDLDPAAAGQQTSASVAGGVFTWQSDGTVRFTPAAGFAGKANAGYTIRDSAGRTSNVAALQVTVKPSPTAPIQLFSFESGTEGWAPGNWQGNAGTVAQSSAFATDGSNSLQVTTADGGWFGAAFSPQADLSSKARIKLDLKTTNTGTSTAMALQLGDGWTWCQSSWGWVNAGTTTTVEFDLNALGCANPELNKVKGLMVWFSGGGVFYIDNVRAE